MNSNDGAGQTFYKVSMSKSMTKKTIKQKNRSSTPNTRISRVFMHVFMYTFHPIVIAVIAFIIGALSYDQLNSYRERKRLANEITNELLVQLDNTVDEVPEIIVLKGSNGLRIKPREMQPTIIWSNVLAAGHIDRLPKEVVPTIGYAYEILEKFRNSRNGIYAEVDKETGTTITHGDSEKVDIMRNLQMKAFVSAMWALVAIEKKYNGIVPAASLKTESYDATSHKLNQLIQREGALFIPNNDYQEWVSMSVTRGSNEYQVIGLWPNTCEDAADMLKGPIQNRNKMIGICGGVLEPKLRTPATDPYR